MEDKLHGKRSFANKIPELSEVPPDFQESATEDVNSSETGYSLESTDCENANVTQKQNLMKHCCDCPACNGNCCLEFNGCEFTLPTESQTKSRNMIYISFTNFEEQLASHKRLCEELMDALNNDSFKYKPSKCKRRTNKNRNKTIKPNKSLTQMMKSEPRQQSYEMSKNPINTDNSKAKSSLSKDGCSYMSNKEGKHFDENIKQQHSAKKNKNSFKVHQSYHSHNMQNVENSTNPTNYEQLIDSNHLYDQPSCSNSVSNATKISNFHCAPFLKHTRMSTASKNHQQNYEHDTRPDTAKHCHAIPIDDELPCSTNFLAEQIMQYNDINRTKYPIKHDEPHPYREYCHHNTCCCCKNIQIPNLVHVNDKRDSRKKPKSYDKVHMAQRQQIPYDEISISNDLHVIYSDQDIDERNSSTESDSSAELELTQIQQLPYCDKDIYSSNNMQMKHSLQFSDETQLSEEARIHDETTFNTIPQTLHKRNVKKNLEQVYVPEHSHHSPEFVEAYIINEFENLVEMGDLKQIYQAARLYQELNPAIAPHLQQILNSFHYLNMNNSNHVSSTEDSNEIPNDNQSRSSKNMPQYVNCSTNRSKPLISKKVVNLQTTAELHTTKVKANSHISEHQSQSKGVQTTPSLFICKCGRLCGLLDRRSQSQETLKKSNGSTHSNDTMKNINLKSYRSLQNMAKSQKQTIILLPYYSDDSMNCFENCSMHNTSSILESSSTTNLSDEVLNSSPLLNYAKLNNIREAEHSSSVNVGTSSSLVFHSATSFCAARHFANSVSGTNPTNISSDSQYSDTSLDGNQSFIESAVPNETISPMLKQQPGRVRGCYTQLRQRH